MRKRTDARLVDGMVSAYVAWHEACHLLVTRIARGGGATGPRARMAFSRYTAALDAEEWAAEAYASLVRRAGDAATRNGDLSGSFAA